MQQSVTKDLRGKINKTPTGAFKMVHDAASLNSKTRSRRLQGGKFMLEILYSCINLKMHTINFSSIFSPLSEVIALLQFKNRDDGMIRYPDFFCFSFVLK